LILFLELSHSNTRIMSFIFNMRKCCYYIFLLLMQKYKEKSFYDFFKANGKGSRRKISFVTYEAWNYLNFIFPFNFQKLVLFWRNSSGSRVEITYIFIFPWIKVKVWVFTGNLLKTTSNLGFFWCVLRLRFVWIEI